MLDEQAYADLSQRCPKTTPWRPQNRAIVVQNGVRDDQERGKIAPESIGITQEARKTSQERPKSDQEALKNAQDRPEGVQERGPLARAAGLWRVAGWSPGLGKIAFFEEKRCKVDQFRRYA